MLLVGQYSSKISAKRRVAVPSKFKRVLGETFILTRWYEGCLVLVGKNEWKKLINILTGRTKGLTEPFRDTDRFLFGMAFEVIPDNQGRIIIPEKLSSYAGIDKSVIFIGLGNRVEVWNERTWLEREKYVTSKAGAFIERLVKEDGA